MHWWSCAHSLSFSRIYRNPTINQKNIHPSSSYGDLVRRNEDQLQINIASFNIRTCMKTECVISGTTGGLIDPNYCYKISWSLTRVILKLAGQTYKSTFFSACRWHISLLYSISNSIASVTCIFSKYRLLLWRYFSHRCCHLFLLHSLLSNWLAGLLLSPEIFFSWGDVDHSWKPGDDDPPSLYTSPLSIFASWPCPTVANKIGTEGSAQCSNLTVHLLSYSISYS